MVDLAHQPEPGALVRRLPRLGAVGALEAETQAALGEVPAEQLTTGHLTTGHLTTGHLTTGHLTTGHLTTRHLTTGRRATGRRATGRRATGRRRGGGRAADRDAFERGPQDLGGEQLLLDGGQLPPRKPVRCPPQVIRTHTRPARPRRNLDSHTGELCPLEGAGRVGPRDERRDC